MVTVNVSLAAPLLEFGSPPLTLMIWPLLVVPEMLMLSLPSPAAMATFSTLADGRPVYDGYLLGGYKILYKIASGSFGRVYRCEEPHTGRIVAIKVLQPDFADQVGWKVRFAREAETIASLNHPHICVLRDVGSHEGVDYLAMSQPFPRLNTSGRSPTVEARNPGGAPMARNCFTFYRMAPCHII